eukprot:gene6314-8694_t
MINLLTIIALLIFALEHVHPLSTTTHSAIERTNRCQECMNFSSIIAANKRNVNYNLNLPSSSKLYTISNKSHRSSTKLYAFTAVKNKLITWMSPTGRKDELTREVLAGLVVALATIPTSISYATIIGLNPLIGLWSSILVGLFVTIIGGGPGLIAGAAGVIALPMGKLYASHGKSYMAGAVILSGLFQIAFGLTKLGKLASLVTEPVIVGFLNSFGIFLIKSQLKIIKTASGALLPSELLQPTLAIATLSAGLIKGLPLIPQIKKTGIPTSLIGIVISTLVAKVLKLPVKSLSDTFGSSIFAGGVSSLPVFQGLPNIPLPLETLSIIFSTTVGAAMIGILETLLAERILSDTIRSKSEIYEEDDPDRTVIGLGVGNIISAVFGGFGGCGLIPNTLLNGSNGGLGYASGFSFAISLALAVLLFSPIIAHIPMASLGGLILTVAYNTIEWKETFDVLKHSNKSIQGFLDLIGMVVTAAVCFKVDMGLGVLLGTIITKIIPILQALKSLTQRKQMEPKPII